MYYKSSMKLAISQHLFSIDGFADHQLKSVERTFSRSSPTSAHFLLFLLMMPVWGDDHCCGHCYFQLIWLLRKIKITQSCGEVQLCPSYWSFVTPIKAKLLLTTLAKSHFLLTYEDFKLRYNANLCIESITVEGFFEF